MLPRWPFAPKYSEAEFASRLARSKKRPANAGPQ